VKSWTAHLHADKPPVLLKEGFAWGALLFGPLWLALHRAWIPAALVLAADVAITVFADAPIRSVLGVAVSWLLGLCGYDLVRWSLGMRGYVLAHVVAARDADSAFFRLLSVRPDLGNLFMPAIRA